MKSFTAILTLLAAPLAAHVYILEPGEGGKAAVYHAEYEEGFRGHRIEKWERYAGLKAWVWKNGRAEELPLAKEDGHFSLALPAGTASFGVSNLERQVADYRDHGLGIVRPFNYARFLLAADKAPAKPSMDLEVLPVPGKPGSFRAWFKGKPLPKAKVQVLAPNFWMQEKEADAEGLFKAELPWAGLYILALRHLEAAPQGAHQGVFYESEYHSAQLCLRQP